MEKYLCLLKHTQTHIYIRVSQHIVYILYVGYMNVPYSTCLCVKAHIKYRHIEVIICMQCLNNYITPMLEDPIHCSIVSHSHPSSLSLLISLHILHKNASLTILSFYPRFSHLLLFLSSVILDYHIPGCTCLSHCIFASSPA